MVTNLSKVIVLPRMSKADKEDFICPCPICMEKLEEEQIIYSQIEEIKKMVEELLESTALSTNDFQIDISYPSVSTEKNIKTYITDSKKTNKFTLSHKSFQSAAAAMRDILMFTFKFNNKYRHPYICSLQDISFTVLKDIQNSSAVRSNSIDTDAVVLYYQQVLGTIHECLYTLYKIKGEGFIDEEVIQKLITKTVKAKSSLASLCKKTFISALQSPEFSPTKPVDEFIQPLN